MEFFEGLEEGAHDAIVIDAPWRFRRFSMASHKRSAENHYETMHMDVVRSLPVKRYAAKDCWLWLWTTGPMLEQAFSVMHSWGFRYSSMGFVWIKTQKRLQNLNQNQLYTEADFFMGMGYTTRKNAEYCLLCKVGHPKRQARDVFEVIIAPRREHSRKPDVAGDRIRRYCGQDARIAEIFSRTDRPQDENWHTWGDERGRFAA